jgi:hypothetical protein
MNNVYFACKTCLIMTDAGYRWAYCQLASPGIVSPASRVSVPKVLAADAYWSGTEVDGSKWLREEILPVVRTFFGAHDEHEIVYGDYETITEDHPRAFLDWLEVGSGPRPTPRWFAEVLRLQRWSEVVAWVRKNRKPAWWFDDELRDIARVRFGELVKRRANNGMQLTKRGGL